MAGENVSITLQRINARYEYFNRYTIPELCSLAKVVITRPQDALFNRTGPQVLQLYTIIEPPVP